MGVLALTALTLGAKAQTNLLKAGDFEGITSLTTYSAPTTGVWGTESAVLSSGGHGITPFGSQMLELTHSGGGSAAQTNQIVYGPFQAGSVVTFSVKFNTWLAASAQTPQSVAVSIQTDSGITLTGTRYASPTVTLDTDTSTWQTATVSVTLPSDTNYISAEIILWMYSGALPYGTPLAYADDAVLTVQKTQTLTILGGSGNTGDVAANVEYYNPSTGSWQPAYLAYFPGNPGLQHPWGLVPGTDHWINYKADGTSDPGAGGGYGSVNYTYWYLYRVRFNVPADAVDPRMTLSLKADNFAQVAINGVVAGGSQVYINNAYMNNVIVGQADQQNIDAVFAQAVHPGENTITLNIGDCGGLNGFNFKIDLSMLSSQPLEVVPTDTTPPVISAPADITAEATGPTGAPVSFTASATDAVDGSVPVVADPVSGSTFPLGTTTVDLGASDSSGNQAFASFSVTVQDTTPPVISAPAPITAEATGANGATVTYSASATDLVDGSVAVSGSPASGSTFPIGTTGVTLSATDAHNNTGHASFLVTVEDTTRPVIYVDGKILQVGGKGGAFHPGSIVVEATGPSGAVVSFNATATDQVDGTVAVNESTPSGSTFPLGNTLVTLTATDAHGNIETQTLRITVVDTTPPVITAPADMTVEATGPDGAAVDYTATAADLVDGAVTVSSDHPSGSTFPLGTTKVTLTATDAAGNSSEASFNVIVEDTTPPVITAPADITAEATSAAGAVVDYAATATDLVDGAVTVGTSAASGSTFPLGTTTVTLTATDAAGNTSTASFNVTVVDTTAPVINSVTPSIATIWPPNHKMVPITIAADATDNTGVTSLKVISITSNEAEDGHGDGHTDVDYAITGDLSVSLRAERAGKGADRVYTITVEATDAYGNSSTSTCTVTVPHDRGDDKDGKSEKGGKGKKGDKDGKSQKQEKTKKSEKGKR